MANEIDIPKRKVILTDVGCICFPGANIPKTLRFAWRLTEDQIRPELDMMFELEGLMKEDLGHFIEKLQNAYVGYIFSDTGIELMKERILAHTRSPALIAYLDSKQIKS